jgi:hypothetical protein
LHGTHRPPPLALILFALIFAAPEAPAEPRADIVALMDSVKTANLDQTVHDMEAYGTRYAGSVTGPTIAQDLLQRFQNYGWETALEEFTFDPDTLGLEPITSWNVVAHRGGWDPDALIILGAHWDSIDEFPGGSYDDAENPAPGANDNGSGIATILEIARILGEKDFRQNIEIILFGAEETKLQGSKHHVDRLVDMGVNVAGYFNVDSVSFDLFEAFDIALYHDNQSAWFMWATRDWVLEYSDTVYPIPYESTNGGANSDVHWFWQYSMPAVSIWEGEDHAPYYNHRLDTFENCNSQNGFHEEVTELVLACFCVWAELAIDTGVADLPRPGTGKLSVYPNPFRANASIRYSAATGAGPVTAVQVFDVGGRLLRTLPFPGDTPVVWNGKDEQGRRLPAGVYLLRPAGDRDAPSKRVVLLR